MRSSSHTDEPVVVTGFGLVSAAGSSVAALEASLAARCHCLTPITAFDTIGLTATHEGEALDFAPLDRLPPTRVNTLDRGTQMAIEAARQALAHAGLDGAPAENAGVAIGVSGSAQFQNIRVFPDRAYPISRQSALYAARSTPSFQADVVARTFDLGGPRFAFASASLGGLLALGHAIDLLRAGLASAMLVGGGEINTLLNALGMGGIGVTAIGPCTPFAGPGGICFGEGAAFFVLELSTAASRRGAGSLGQLVATGFSADAYSDVAQDPSGKGLTRAVQKALGNADTDSCNIGWVRACGTGQRELDAAETIGLHAAFDGLPPPVTSTEPYFSHVNGVSPLLGLAAVLVALGTDSAPCLPDTKPAIVRPGLALTPLAPGSLPEGDCLLTATAFGGTNGALVVRRCSGSASSSHDRSATIVIAGIGAITPFGGTADALLQGLAADEAPKLTGAARLVDEAWLRQPIQGVQMQRRERVVRMAMLAVREALAGCGIESRGSARIGVLVGLTRGPASAYERFFAHALQGRFDITTGRMLLRVGRFSVASEITHAFGLLGYSGAMAPGVHGGVQLLAHGAELLRASADLDALLVVAADEWTALLESLYGQLGLLGDGAAYDPAASGCIGGEGAAAILLSRRASDEVLPNDWAAIAGTGFSGDSGTRPDALGRSYRRAIDTAIGRAGSAPSDIGLAIGQGCGWPAHDERERAALAQACPDLPVTSVLSRTGLAESAGGLFGAIAAASSLRGRTSGKASRALLVGSSERGAHAAVVMQRLAA